jgi:hypothetical protein
MDVIILEALCISGSSLIFQVFLKVFYRILAICNCSSFGNIHPFAKKASIHTHIFTPVSFGLGAGTPEGIIV